MHRCRDGERIQRDVHAGLWGAERMSRCCCGANFGGERRNERGFMTRLPSLELPRSVSSPLVGQSHRPQRPATADVPPPLVTSSALQLLSSASEMQDGFGEDSVRMSLSEWLQSFELDSLIGDLRL